MYFFYCLIQGKVVSKKGLQILIESEVGAYFLKSYSKENMRLLLTCSVSPVASGRRERAEGRRTEQRRNRGVHAQCTPGNHARAPIVFTLLPVMVISYLLLTPGASYELIYCLSTMF